MAKQIRNPKTLQAKAKKCVVAQVSATEYKVQSPSGNEPYIVRHLGQGYACNCLWGQHTEEMNPASGCAHVIAVVGFEAAKVNRKVAAWVSEEDAKRQHNKYDYIGNNVYISTRLGAH